LFRVEYNLPFPISLNPFIPWYSYPVLAVILNPAQFPKGFPGGYDTLAATIPRDPASPGVSDVTGGEGPEISRRTLHEKIRNPVLDNEDEFGYGYSALNTPINAACKPVCIN